MKSARDLYNALSNATPKIQFLSDAQDFFAKKIGLSTENLKKFNQEMLRTPASKEGRQLLDRIKNENELLKIQDKKTRFIESISSSGGEISTGAEINGNTITYRNTSAERPLMVIAE